MKNILFLTVLGILLIVNPGHANSCRRMNFQPDSLQRVIAMMNNDTAKVIKQLLLIREYSKDHPEKAFTECRKALKLADELQFADGLADVNYELCYLYKLKGDLDSSLMFINRFLTLSGLNFDSVRLAKGYLQYGNIIQRKGDLETAHDYFSKSRFIYQKTSDTLGLISTYNAMGIIFRKSSRLDSAAVYYLKALQLSEQLEYSEGIGPLLNNLGKIYYELKDFQNARKYLEKSIEVNMKLKNMNHVSMAYTNLGSIALDENEFERAGDFFQKAIEIEKGLGNKIMLNNLYINLGTIFQRQGKLYQALKNFETASNEFRKIGYKEGIVSAMMNKASVYLEQGNYSKSLVLLDSCLIIAKSPGDIEMRKNIFKRIYKTYAAKGDFKNAFKFQSKYYELKDSIITLNAQNSVAELTLKYEKKKDQTRILTLENENLEKDLNLRKRTNQRNIYLFTGIGLVLMAFALTVYFRQKALTNKKFAEQKIRQLEEEKRMLAAKSIVEGQEEERKRIAKELHDGLGVLLSAIKMQFTSIREKNPENGPVFEKANKLLEQASSDVRKISHNMMPGLLTRLGLYEAVEDLFDNLNNVDGLQAQLTISGDKTRLPENMEIMIYRVVQEMVNNTLKHAKASEISFSILRIENQVHFIYQDNGQGFDVDQAMQNKSIGINSILSRVNFLKGHIDIFSVPGEGTQIVFDLMVPSS